MNKQNEIIYKTIGRKIFLKYSVVTVLLFLILPIIIFTPYYFFSSEPGSPIAYAKNMTNDISENFWLLIIQAGELISFIWFFAAIPVQQIIERNRNNFWTSFIAVFVLWLILFISSELTGGIIHSMTYGWKAGFEAAVFDWFFYTLIIWLIFAIVSGFIISPFIGREIMREATKENLIT